MSTFVDEDENLKAGKIIAWIAVGVVGLVVVCVVFFGAITPAIGRYQDRQDRQQARTQARKDAQNKVAVSAIEIRNQEQRIKVTKQQAAIRYQNAVGVREAQDEIAKTLNPLYVQFEMVDALKAIAKSGRNSSVVYIPTGANGIPLISSADQNKVAQP